MPKHRLTVTTYELERILRGIQLSVIDVTKTTREQLGRTPDRVDLAEPYFDVLAQDKVIEKRLAAMVAKTKAKPVAKKPAKK